jgi:hypothetical protein
MNRSLPAVLALLDRQQWGNTAFEVADSIIEARMSALGMGCAQDPTTPVPDQSWVTLGLALGSGTWIRTVASACTATVIPGLHCILGLANCLPVWSRVARSCWLKTLLRNNEPAQKGSKIIQTKLQCDRQIQPQPSRSNHVQMYAILDARAPPERQERRSCHALQPVQACAVAMISLCIITLLVSTTHGLGAPGCHRVLKMRDIRLLNAQTRGIMILYASTYFE